MSGVQPDLGPVIGPYKVGFFRDHIPMLEAGQKWLTYRLADPFAYLKVGDAVELREHGTHRLLGETKIVRVTQLSLAELPVDGPGHEIYQSKEHQRQVLSSYAKRDLGLEEKFLVIEFEPL